MNSAYKEYIYPKGRKGKNRPKQLQTHNLSTDDVENIKGLRFTTCKKATDCSLSCRKDSAKDPEELQSYFI